MRILLTTDTIGGVWDHTVTLATELRSRGHDVFLAVLGRVDPARERQIPESCGWEANNLRLEWLPGAEADLAPGREWLRELVGRWAPDVLHLNQLTYASPELGVPTLVAVHSDVVSWFSETRGSEPGPEWAAYRATVSEGLRAADLLVAPSRYQAELTGRHFGRRVEVVVHNGVEVPRRTASRERTPVLLAVGRAWDAAKGFGILDAALASMGDGAPEGHLFGSLEGPAGERFHPDRLIAHGRAPRTELESWMGSAAVVAAPSLYEPFGLVAVEGALRGCALILSDIGSFRELWEGCAEFVPPGDAQSLAGAVQRLMRDEGHRRELSEAARDRALERYTAGRMAAGYESVYRTLCHSEAATGA